MSYHINTPRLISRKPRLCFVSYRHIREFALPVLAEFADRADIEVVDAAFDNTLRVARDRMAQGLVDAFVSAGSNAVILRTVLQVPVAMIELTGFDLLQALLKARLINNRVGIVMYGNVIPELDSVKSLLNIEIKQYAYSTPHDARECFERLRRDGFEVIVGSSLVVELAQECGLTGLLAYSQSSIRKSLEEAIEMARVSWLENSRYEQLNAVLHNLQEAVLAVNLEHRIIAVNQPMQKLLGQPIDMLMGQLLDEIEPELSLQAILHNGQEQRSVAKHFAQRDWLMHSSPIREHGHVVGAAMTLYDAKNIEAAETSLRIQQRKRQTTARHSFDSLIGSSALFEEVITRAQRFAKTDLTVMISGETGTGKELFAQAIHNNSARAEHPFVAVNCAAFPESLLESELFGYEEGAFTGAKRGGKRGLIEAAHGGTLFLDEIGDMPLVLQSRLLRVLQEREVMRLGSSSAIPVDIRVIAATHQRLQELLEQQQFREDLYYRINTLRLTLPPLRDRGGDVSLLAERFLQKELMALNCQLSPSELLAPILPRLDSYEWPGNVRELHNICQRLAVFFTDNHSQGEAAYKVFAKECPELFDSVPYLACSAQEEALTLDRVHAAMELAQGKKEQAAKILGVSRSTLWRWERERKASSDLPD